MRRKVSKFVPLKRVLKLVSKVRLEALNCRNDDSHLRSHTMSNVHIVEFLLASQIPNTIITQSLEVASRLQWDRINISVGPETSMLPFGTWTIYRLVNSLHFDCWNPHLASLGLLTIQNGRRVHSCSTSPNRSRIAPRHADFRMKSLPPVGDRTPLQERVWLILRDLPVPASPLRQNTQTCLWGLWCRETKECELTSESETRCWTPAHTKCVKALPLHWRGAAKNRCFRLQQTRQTREEC